MKFMQLHTAVFLFFHQITVAMDSPQVGMPSYNEKSYEFRSFLPMDTFNNELEYSYGAQEASFNNEAAARLPEPSTEFQDTKWRSGSRGKAPAAADKSCSGKFAYRDINLEDPQSKQLLPDKKMRNYHQWYCDGKIDHLKMIQGALQVKVDQTFLDLRNVLGSKYSSKMRRLSFLNRLLWHHQDKVKAQAAYEAQLKSGQGLQVRTDLEPGESARIFDSTGPVMQNAGNPALVQSKPVEQKAEEPAIMTSPIQSLKSPPSSPRRSGQDYKMTTPSMVINISPDVDAHIQQRFAEIKGCETFEQCHEKVGAILESMRLSGELIPEQRRDLLVRGIKTYFKRLADPIGIVKDQLHSMMSIALVVCHVSGFDEGHLDVAEILALEQQMDAAFSGFSSENLSKITSEQWADLIATAAADLTFGMGVTKTVALLREIDAAGKAVGCIKLAKALEEKAVQSGIKLAKSVEDRLARAAVLGEEVITCDGIVLHVPPELGEASVLKSGMQEGTKKLSACLPAEVARFEEIRSVVEKLHPALHKNIDKIEELHQIIAKVSGNVSTEKVGSLLDGIGVTKFERLEKQAELFYESIRATTKDVIAISENTGISKEFITRIKNHVFMEEHLLDGHRVGRFLVDIDMAASWQRLINNKFLRSDLLLLQHEYTEALIMNGVEIAWGEAHSIVDKVYNWKTAL